MLKIIDICLQAAPELKLYFGSDDRSPSMVTELFTKCLFYCSTEFPEVGDFRENDSEVNSLQKDYVKAKSSDTRNLVYDLLRTLCIGCQDNIMVLIRDGILKLYEIVGNKGKDKSSLTGFKTYSSDNKSVFGYVGIKNLGCICYMNAMLQQFFMTQQFRYAVL